MVINAAHHVFIILNDINWDRVEHFEKRHMLNKVYAQSLEAGEMWNTSLYTFTNMV